MLLLDEAILDWGCSVLRCKDTSSGLAVEVGFGRKAGTALFGSDPFFSDYYSWSEERQQAWKQNLVGRVLQSRLFFGDTKVFLQSPRFM